MPVANQLYISSQISSKYDRLKNNSFLFLGKSLLIYTTAEIAQHHNLMPQQAALPCRCGNSVNSNASLSVSPLEQRKNGKWLNKIN